jgi:UDP-2-acetamido-2,6-beta-L-arabino-hexul-4-ose reductase
MKILITGSTGFIGRNLIEALVHRGAAEIMGYSSSSDYGLLKAFSAECDFVYHLAAVHRPLDESDFNRVNHLLFADLLYMLQDEHNYCPVLLASSIHTGTNSGYGLSKLAAEQALKKHAELTGARAIIYRLTNTFGRYARPNSHSVVATFCYNIARGLPIVISDPKRLMKLYYIDDVVASFVKQLDNGSAPDESGFYRLPKEQEYEISLQNLADTIYSFKSDLNQGLEPAINDLLSEYLYRTFKSYLT